MFGPGAYRPDPTEGITAIVDLPDRKSTRLNSSHLGISYAVFCLKKKKQANLMDNNNIWHAMAKAFEASKGDLADGMIAALNAAKEATGYIRERTHDELREDKEHT